MKYRPCLNPNQFICSLFLLMQLFVHPAAVRGDQAMVAGYPAAEALRLGEAMYTQGVLPSGKPIQAVVQGDLEISGSMSTCANCHHRSGMGSLEGGVVTPPTNGVKLYAPLLGQQNIPGSVMKRSMFTNPPRPAYSDESLAKVLQSGIDPSGRRLKETMPRYLMDEDASKLMVYYLKNLTSKMSPGVNDDEIRFATIVTADAIPRDRDAMLLPLEAYLREEWNNQLSVLGSSWNNRWFGSTNLPGGKTYRKAVLDVWELKGPPGTWNSQLEAYYGKTPVFAILGGSVPGSWAPIHEFCEKNKIPCIFPLTDQPVISAADRYTLYFSKGFYQEGEAAAKYLSRVIELPPEKKVIQIYRDNDEGKALAKGFEDTWKKLGSSPLTNRAVSAHEKTGANFWDELSAIHPDAVMLVWLGPADIAGLESLSKSANKPSTLFLSSTLLAGSLAAVPDKVRDFAFITYPTRLPGNGEYTRNIVASWMKMKKIPITNLEVSSQVYFFTRLLSFALLDMGVDFYRDFFLDLLDDGADQTSSSAKYPVLSFGPGQRYASKGCYVVTLTKGENPKIVRQSDWVIY